MSENFIESDSVSCSTCRDLGLVKIGEIPGTLSSAGPTDVMKPCPDCQEPKALTDD